MFSKLWIDEPDAVDRVTETGWLGTALRDFIRDGYVILPEAVAHDAIDRYRAEFEGVVGRRSGLQSVYGAKQSAVEDADLRAPLTKTLDTYIFAPAAHSLMFASKITQFLNTIFRDDILAFQGLHFEVGSTQAIHQDTAYVVVDHPLQLAASWVALEDVSAGSGELVYYPGSHRFPHYLYDGRKHFNGSLDRKEMHDQHLVWIREEAARRGIEIRSFLPKKGDALIWHADLAHGGGAITQQDVTRRSLVTHYCPISTAPYYLSLTHGQKIPVGKNAVCSMYYERPLVSAET